MDYRDVGKQIMENRCALPCIHNLSDEVQVAKLFNSVDLQSAYYQGQAYA